MNQVDKALNLLKNGNTNLTQEEFSILLELHQQLGLLFLNLTASGTDKTDTIITKSLEYLASTINQHAKKIPSEPTHKTNLTNTRKQQIEYTQFYQTNNEEDEQEDIHLPKRGVVTTEITRGKITYLLDGEPLKFKKLKDTTIYHQRWQAKYATLKSFYEQYGHVNLTRSTEGHEELGNWVTEQRRKLKNGKVSQRQFELLNELGKKS